MKITVPRIRINPSAMMISGLPVSQPGTPGRIGLSVTSRRSRYANTTPRITSHLRSRFWRVRSRFALASMSLPESISPLLSRAISMGIPFGRCVSERTSWV